MEELEAAAESAGIRLGDVVTNLRDAVQGYPEKEREASARAME
jgi:hypothetical protein